jgi:hypothetical protein
MSTKKKKNPVADDLIQSLMNDLNQSKSESSPQGEDVDSLFTVDSGDIPIEVLGSDQADRVESTNAAISNMWDSLEKNISDSIEKEVESPAPIEPPGGEFFAEGFEIPSVGDDAYDGPSAEGGYQNADHPGRIRAALLKRRRNLFLITKIKQFRFKMRVVRQAPTAVLMKQPIKIRL